MCSILGGTKFNEYALEVYLNAKDRGRDYTGLSQYGDLWIANHRATPTNEKENPVQNQPFGKGFKIVHNGTISNDEELGVGEGRIDSEAISNVINPENIHTIKKSLEMIKGSFAIAVMKKDEIILACNYKPIFYIEKNGEMFFSSLKWHLGKDAIRVKPYSILNLMTKESVDIDRNQPNKAIIICSGGLDSTSIIGYANKKHDEIKLIHFNYGCKATNKEIEAVNKIANYYKCEYDVIDLDYNKFKGNSTLFKDADVKSGKAGVEYALDWVPARNLIMLSIATGYCEANDYGYIYLGSNLEESGAYPDNEEQFIIDFNNLLYGAVNNGFKVEIVSPLGGLMKKEIVEFGKKWGSPISLSWSCYNGGDIHCGECGPCYMRKQAFKRSGVLDKTEYKI